VTHFQLFILRTMSQNRLRVNASQDARKCISYTKLLTFTFWSINSKKTQFVI